MSVLRDESFYYQYEQNGGIVEMPKEVFWELYNDSKEEIERLNNIINEFDKFLFGELQTYGGGGIVQEYYDRKQE